ncbi:hypothetical protein BGZ46_000674 [Entomortierella lignicola]|nr:hypothetical protein BGZ46_000674 [Entomortierella lignicola]
MALWNAPKLTTIQIKQSGQDWTGKDKSKERMLHELLIALSGYPGDIFQPFPPEPAIATTFAISDIPLLHPSEKESLDRLAQLGFYYRKFNYFISTCRSLTYQHDNQTTSAKPAPSGLYLRALAYALEQKLQEYRKVIVETEAAILSGQDNLGGVIPLTSIAARFAPFQLVFPAISSLLSDIESASMSDHPLIGGKLINILQDRAASGVPALEEWMTELLRGCYAVMMKQVVSWVIYGQIQDPFNEFFITALCTNPGISSTSKSLGVTARTNAGLSTTLSASYSTPKSTKWQAEYGLNESMLPTMIPMSLANAILFIGKSIATAMQAKPKPINIPRSMSQQHMSMILPYTSAATTTTGSGISLIQYNTLNVNQLTNIIDQIRKDIGNHLWAVVQIGEKVVKALESFRRYFLLSDGEFGLGLIEALDEFKRNRLSRHSQFASITTPLVSIRNHDLGGILTKAAQGTSSPDDPALRNFELRLQQPHLDEHESGISSPTREKSTTTGMFDDQILGIPVRLWYTMMWPLDFFIAAEDLEHYSDMFAFLLTIRKAQVKLQQAWVDIKSMNQQMMSRRRKSVRTNNRRSGGLKESSENYAQEAEILKHIATMRSDIIFVVDCLWSYLQMDVISPTYDTLLRNISGQETKQTRHSGTFNVNSSPTASLSFDTIHSSHAEALYEIRHACLLTSETLLSSVKEILLGAETFCGILKRRAAGQDGFEAGLGVEQDESMWKDWTELSALHRLFRENVKRLFSDLSEISRSGSLGDRPVLKTSVSGLGSSLVGNGANAFGAIRQLDQLLLRLEYSKRLWFNETSLEEQESVTPDSREII